MPRWGAGGPTPGVWGGGAGGSPTCHVYSAFAASCLMRARFGVGEGVDTVGWSQGPGRPAPTSRAMDQQRPARLPLPPRPPGRWVPPGQLACMAPHRMYPHRLPPAAARLTPAPSPLITGPGPGPAVHELQTTRRVQQAHQTTTLAMNS